MLVLVVLVLLLLPCSAAAETLIEEYDDRLVVRIIGSPAAEPVSGQVHDRPADAEPDEQQQELQRLREEAGRLRLPVAGETPEQSRERRTQAAEAQARLRALEQTITQTVPANHTPSEP